LIRTTTTAPEVTTMSTTRPQYVSREQAEAVLEELKTRFLAWDVEAANLRDHTHEELPKGCWSIGWEGQGFICPEAWAVDYQTEVPGVFVEPLNSVILGLYPA
jgi:hypothetical protein